MHLTSNDLFHTGSFLYNPNTINLKGHQLLSVNWALDMIRGNYRYEYRLEDPSLEFESYNIFDIFRVTEGKKRLVNTACLVNKHILTPGDEPGREIYKDPLGRICYSNIIHVGKDTPLFHKHICIIASTGSVTAIGIQDTEPNGRQKLFESVVISPDRLNMIGLFASAFVV